MHIGIDIGGSHIGLVLFDNEFKIVKKIHICLEKNVHFDDMVQKLEQGISEIITSDVVDIGIGVPAICDINKKIVIKASNLNLFNVDFVTPLTEKFNIPVFFDNDANCATIGEMNKGRLKDVKNAVLLTVGTGIGGGIVIDYKLYRGSTYNAGEFGHVVLVRDGIKCGCGSKGCFEKYASLSALKKQCQEAGYNFDNIKDVFISEDKHIIDIVKQWVEYLSDGIAGIYDILDLDSVVIGGGASEYFEYFGDMLNERVQAKILSSNRKIEVKKALLLNDAGAIGAAMLESV